MNKRLFESETQYQLKGETEWGGGGVSPDKKAAVSYISDGQQRREHASF